MQLLLKDIYGGSAYLDFTLIVDVSLTSPPGVQNCYADLGVVPSGFAFDTNYILGTLKQVKL